MVEEIWLPIEKVAGEYEVSSLGRVRSTDKIIVRGNGRLHTRRSKILRPAKDAGGYYRVALSYQGQLITCKVHRLVAEAFIPNPHNKASVNHKDGDKSDNRMCALEWATHEEQVSHAVSTGLIKMKYTAEERKQSVNKIIKRGSLNGCSLLTEQVVREIRRKFIPTVYTRKMLADEFNVTVSAIKDVLSRRTWKHA